MKSPIVRWLLVLNSLMLCSLLIFLAIRFHEKQNSQLAESAKANAMVREAEKNDTTSEFEKKQLQQISDGVQAKKEVTDSQLAFLLNEMNKPNPKGVATVSSLTASISLFYLKRPLSASQKAILYQQLTPALIVQDATPGSGITLTQMQKLDACDLLARFDVQEATPQILPLLNDPKPQIRANAKRALKKLGYST